MIIFIADLAASTVIGLLFLLRGRDRGIDYVSSAHWLRIVALIPPGVQFAILLLFGFGEMTSGDSQMTSSMWAAFYGKAPHMS